MVKVSFPLLVFLGVILWAPGLNNSAIAVLCCKHDGTYSFSDWVYNAETVRCCATINDTGVCYIKTRLITADLECIDHDCDEPYYDDGCWFPCCDDDKVIQQAVGCGPNDKVTWKFLEHQKDPARACALVCFCKDDTGPPYCTSWYAPYEPGDCDW